MNAKISVDLKSTEAKQWMVQQIVSRRAQHSLVVAYICAVGAPLMLILGPRPVNVMLLIYFSFLGLNNFIYAVLQKRTLKDFSVETSLRKSHLQFASMQVGTWIFLVLFMWQLGGDPNLALSFRIAGLAIYLILAEQVDIFSRTSTWFSLGGSVVHIASGALAWHLAGWELSTTATGILVITHGWMWFVRFGIKQALVRQANYWLESRQLELQNASLKVAAVERDLEFAKVLQSSGEELPKAFRQGRLAVRVFQKPYDTIGGDWVGMRTLPDGSLVTVVADVNGKGMPAAMVSQSLQTLWIKSLDAPHFDPLAWLTEVNLALCELGRREPYTLTLGLLVVTASSLTYLSAGHVPLFVIGDTNDPRSVKPVLATGSPLGLGEKPEITGITVPMPIGNRCALVLGSDGIINLQLRRSRRAVYDFVLDLEHRGEVAFNEYPEPDDKTLVYFRAVA